MYLYAILYEAQFSVFYNNEDYSAYLLNKLLPLIKKAKIADLKAVYLYTLANVFLYKGKTHRALFLFRNLIPFRRSFERAKGLFLTKCLLHYGNSLAMLYLNDWAFKCYLLSYKHTRQLCYTLPDATLALRLLKDTKFLIVDTLLEGIFAGSFYNATHFLNVALKIYTSVLAGAYIKTRPIKETVAFSLGLLFLEKGSEQLAYKFLHAATVGFYQNKERYKQPFSFSLFSSLSAYLFLRYKRSITNQVSSLSYFRVQALLKGLAVFFIKKKRPDMALLPLYYLARLLTVNSEFQKACQHIRRTITYIKSFLRKKPIFFLQKPLFHTYLRLLYKLSTQIAIYQKDLKAALKNEQDYLHYYITNESPNWERALSTVYSYIHLSDRYKSRIISRIRNQGWQRAIRELKEKHLLYEKEVQRMNQEIAQTRALIKKVTLPKHPHFQFFYQVYLTQDLGGSFIDYGYDAQNRLMIMLGDTTGTGLHTYLYAAIVQSYFQYYCDKNTPMMLIERIAQAIRSIKIKPLVYIALALLVFDETKIRVYGMGMAPAYLHRAQKAEMEVYPLKGVWLGVPLEMLGDVEQHSLAYSYYTLELQPHDTLFIFSDAVEEIAQKQQWQSTQAWLEKSIIPAIHHHGLQEPTPLQQLFKKQIQTLPERLSDDFVFLAVHRYQ